MEAVKIKWFSSNTHKIPYSNSYTEFTPDFQSFSCPLFFFLLCLYISLLTFHTTGNFCSHCVVSAAYHWLKSYLCPPVYSETKSITEVQFSQHTGIHWYIPVSFKINTKFCLCNVLPCLVPDFEYVCLFVYYLWMALTVQNTAICFLM